MTGVDSRALLQMIRDTDSSIEEQIQQALAQPGPTHDLELDIRRDASICENVRNNDSYAQNLYAALCNTEWQEQDVWEILSNRVWSCTWRRSGYIVAQIRRSGSYLDWYCSGVRAQTELESHEFCTEGEVAPKIKDDLRRIGWTQVDHHTE